MKNKLIFICFFFCCSQLLYAQTFDEMMQKQKATLADKTEFIIDVKQAIYEDGELDERQSFTTHMIGKDGRLFWETPDVKMVRNERAYLMIREEDQLIMYSSFKTKLDIEKEAAAGLANWDEAIQKYIEAASSIEQIESGNRLGFKLIMKQSMYGKVKIYFDEKTSLMTSFECVLEDKSGVQKRLHCQLSYDFETKISSSQFDEKKYVTTGGSTPKGKGEYATFKVVYTPVD